MAQTQCLREGQELHVLDRARVEHRRQLGKRRLDHLYALVLLGEAAALPAPVEGAWREIEGDPLGRDAGRGPKPAHPLQHVQFRAGLLVGFAPGGGLRRLAPVDQARRETSNSIVWIPHIVPKDDIITIYTHAAVFVCPSVYEPFGIINLEAMACETAVVASAVGGIPEVVVDGETGLLVPFEPAGGDSFEPADSGRFERDLATAVQTLLDDPDRSAAMGRIGRQRAVDHFSWASIADQTVTLYRSLIR